jgi:hypothetical protein
LEKSREIIADLETFAKDHEVDHVVLVLARVSHTTNEAEDSIYQIKDFFFRQGFTVSTIHVSVVTKKKEWTKELTEKFPELKAIHVKELKKKKPYYRKLFEAVAAAVNGE